MREMNKEKLERIVGAITVAESNLMEVENKALELDMKKLNEVISIAGKKLNYEKIYNIAEGSYMGINLDNVFLDFNNATVLVKRELWLLENGEFKVFDIIEDKKELERVVSDNQKIEQFDLNKIVKNIYDNLNSKLKNLESRNKTQMENKYLENIALKYDLDEDRSTSEISEDIKKVAEIRKKNRIKVACEKIMQLENEIVDVTKEHNLEGFNQLTDTFVNSYITIDDDGIVHIDNREICKAEEIGDIEKHDFENGIESITIFHQKFNDVNEDKTVWIIRKKWNESKIDVQYGF